MNKRRNETDCRRAALQKLPSARRKRLARRFRGVDYQIANLVAPDQSPLGQAVQRCQRGCGGNVRFAVNPGNEYLLQSYCPIPGQLRLDQDFRQLFPDLPDDATLQNIRKSIDMVVEQVRSRSADLHYCVCAVRDDRLVGVGEAIDQIADNRRIVKNFERDFGCAPDLAAFAVR